MIHPNSRGFFVLHMHMCRLKLKMTSFYFFAEKTNFADLPIIQQEVQDLGFLLCLFASF